MITFLNIIMLIVSATLSFFVIGRLLGVQFKLVPPLRLLSLSILMAGYFGFSRANLLFHIDIDIPTSISITISVLLMILASHLLYRRGLVDITIATCLNVCITIITEIVSGVVYMLITKALPSNPGEYLAVTCLDAVVTLIILIITKDKLTKIHRSVMNLLGFSKKGNNKIILGQLVFGVTSVFLITIIIVDLLKSKSSSYTLMGLGVLFILLIFGFNYVVLKEILGDKVKLAKLEQEKLYTDAYSLVIQDVKSYWHNHANILDTLKICLYSEDVTKEEMVHVIGEYVDWSTSLDIANKVKLTQLSHPVLAGILKLKYDYARALGVKLTLNSIGATSINMNMVEFTEVVGVLLDNAIEVASLADNPVVDVDIIFEKVFSIRILNFVKIVDNVVLKQGVSRGIGLKTITNILKKYPSAHVEVTNTDTYYDVLFTVGG